MTSEEFTLALRRSLAAENVSFTTYALMLAVNSRADPPTVLRLTTETGYSYQAISRQVERTPYFIREYGSGLVRLTLTADAKTKLERIAQRIPKPVSL